MRKYKENKEEIEKRDEKVSGSECYQRVDGTPQRNTGTYRMISSFQILPDDLHQ